MGVRLEEAIVAVCAPDARGADLRVTRAVYEGNRYFFYAVDAQVVVLVENQALAITKNPRSEAKRISQFNLWQIWNSVAGDSNGDQIRCVRYNRSRKAACGAVAVCIDEGRGVLLMPSPAPITTVASATSNARTGDGSSRPTLFREIDQASKLHVPESDYARAHLHLQLPTWRESTRWKSEDPLMDRMEWVESGDDQLFLVGAGERITVWKVVDDAVQMYFQRSFAVIAAGGISPPSMSDVQARHFAVTQSSHYIATAGAHDRILKVWNVNDLALDGTPVCLFLAHSRALVAVQWAKDVNTFKLRSSTANAPNSEMLYALDKDGNISIWRENTGSKRSFVLWKRFCSAEYLDSDRFYEGSFTQEPTDKMKSFGLVNYDWVRALPSSLTTVTDAMLDEANVLSALSLFHYGTSNIDDIRRSELYNQRMDSATQMNSQLIGDRSGMTADTHAGETFINGNAALNKTFSVHLLYGVQENGELCLFRTEFITFSGVTPRVSLLVAYSGLRDELADAQVHSVSSSDYNDRESGCVTFVVEVLFQPSAPESNLKMARLKLQAEASSFGIFRNSRGSVCYSVQSCDIGDMSKSIMSARQANGHFFSLATAKVRIAENSMDGAAEGMTILNPVNSVKIAVSNVDHRLDILRCSDSLREVQVSRPHTVLPMSSASHSVCYEEQNMLFFFSDSKLYAGRMMFDDTNASDTVSPVPVSTFSTLFISTGNGATTGPALHDDSLAASMEVCFEDNTDDEEIMELEDLIMVNVPESQKSEWSMLPSSTSIFFQTEEPSLSSKDFCLLVGMCKQNPRLTMWMFSFEETVCTDNSSTTCAPTIKLFRKAQINIPQQNLLGIAPLPSMRAFDTMFASVDSDFVLDIWAFSDVADLQETKSVHRVDIGKLLSLEAEANRSKDASIFHSVEAKLSFRQFCASACGRLAILIDEDTSTSGSQATNVAKVCILSAFDHRYEDIVVIPHNKYGRVISLEWTPPITADRHCELFFLSTTTIGVIKCESVDQQPKKWSVVWNSSRLSVRPQKISSLTNFPHVLLGLGSSIARVDLRDLSAPSTTPSRVYGGLTTTVPKMNDVPTTSFEPHHPITLMFLLARGSFKPLEVILNFVRESIMEHEKTCYLRMDDASELRSLPMLSLSELLPKANDDERSAAYLEGKKSGKTGFGSSNTNTTQPMARASDLFAMDYKPTRSFGSSSNYGASDRADMLFAPGASTSSFLEEEVTEKAQSSLETNEFIEFFTEHRESLSFMSPAEQEVFMAIVKGVKKTLAWDSDASRKKDEAALRFHASLIWPLEPAGSGNKPAVVESSTASDELDQPKVETIEDDDTLKRSVGICSEQVAWGAITDHQTQLLQECLPVSTITWKEMLQLRLPFWVQSAAKLQVFTEKVAQSEFASTRDPFGVALFYVLLGKTKLLASLFKMANESRISDLLSNDFSDSRWKNAAIKNAYVLKTKQRYEISAAFFLLGGKVQEAVSVAEHADRTLVLSFLIARLSEKWDLGGTDENNNAMDFSQSSFTGLSDNLRHFGTTGAVGSAVNPSESGCKGICTDFLQSTVWRKASECGDIYSCFLVKYLSGATHEAIQCLVVTPKTTIHCMFGSDASENEYPFTLYWRTFGQSMLGACDLVRFLRKTIVPRKMALKAQIMNAQTIALSRLQGMGLTTVALFQQRDFHTFFQQFCQEGGKKSTESALFLGVRYQILATVMGCQHDFIFESFQKSLHQAMLSKSPLNIRFELQSRLNNELASVVDCGGNFEVKKRLDTHNSYMEGLLRRSVIQFLVHSGRISALEFLVSSWISDSSFILDVPFSRPVPHFVEVITEGVSALSSGDLNTASMDPMYTKRVEQTCSSLLTCASRLLLWLLYFYTKPTEERTSLGSSDFVRVATAAIYSAICVCCRYIKNPCCLYRSFSVIFPHKDPLSKKMMDKLNEIAMSDVCAYCSASRTNAAVDPSSTGIPSLQQALPALYQVVQSLQQELVNFVSEVKTNRLQLAAFTNFSFCQYWTLVLMMSTSAMPAHLSKIAIEGSTPNSYAMAAGKKLVQAWSTYNTNLSKYATKQLLCDMAESYFRPVSIRVAANSNSSTPLPSPSVAAAAASGSATSSSPMANEKRQLLRCTCDHCPWLLIMKLFADKDEFLLRLNAQLDCCSAKIKEEISWGHLPELPSKKAALTRSQRILLSNAAEKAGTSGRAADIADILEKRMQYPMAATLSLQCIYRNDTSIKSMCFNKGTDTPEMIVCSSKGISRTGCVDYSDGSKFQFKGMYANPKSTFFAEGTNASGPMRRITMDSLSLGGGSYEFNSSSPSFGNKMNSSSSSLLSSSSSLSDSKASSFKPTAVESHPFLPLFVSGNQKGKVHLWSYDSLSSICSFQTNEIVAMHPTSPTMASRRDVKKIRFDELGQQMGAVDTVGRLLLWKFANLDRETCYREIECHDKGAKALTFINSGSCIATVGNSAEKKNVCVWDTLMPNSKALVAAPVCHPAGAASVAFSSMHQLLISGGEGGSISVFDMRQRRVLHTISNAHETAITTLELHPSGHCVLSGSASGEVKIWSLPIFREVAVISKVHAKPSFLGDAASNILGDAASNMAINVTSLSWGVTDAVATDDYFFTSGTDGSVQRFKVPALRSVFRLSEENTEFSRSISCMAPTAHMASHPPVSASQAAVDSFVITQLLDNGMDVVARRINHLQKKIQLHEDDPPLQRKCARQLQHWLVVACRLLRQHRSQLTHCIDTLEADLKSGALPVLSEADISSASSISGTPRTSRADSIQSPPLSAIVMPGPNEPLVPCGGHVAAKVARSHELWILARIVAFHAASDSYEVEDVDTSEDDGTRRHHLVPRHQVVEMVADRLPEHEWIQYGVNQRVMAMYPNTTSFFRATIQVPNPKGAPCVILKFDDDAEEYSVAPDRAVPFRFVAPLKPWHYLQY